MGVVRITIYIDNKREDAVIIADPWQGLWLGSQTVDYMIEICKDIAFERIYTLILPDN